MFRIARVDRAVSATLRLARVRRATLATETASESAAEAQEPEIVHTPLTKAQEPEIVQTPLKKAQEPEKVQTPLNTSWPATKPSLPALTFKEVKFMKEDVDQVMTELPAFEFYEMNESVPNPYQGTTLDRSILLDPPKPAVKREQAQFSKLENGLKIGSLDRGGLKAEIGLFVDAGSRFETSANFGVSNMISSMAFKSTAHLSNLRTVKTLEQLGANNSSTCTVSAEETVYQVGVMREYVPLVVPLLVGNVLFPRLLPWEVTASQKAAKAANQAVSADESVREMLQKTAYCNNSLGLSTRATERSNFTPETIRSFMIDHFAPERMVLVGVNVNHEELCKWAMRSFVDYNAIPLKSRDTVKSSYTGGDSRMDGTTPFCHVAIGLESVPFGSDDLAATAILQTLLGGGSAASNSIGCSSASRLAKQVVGQNPYVESCSAFNQSFSDSGLFGVYGVCHPEKSALMASSMLDALKSLKTVTGAELDEAKAVLKGKIGRELDFDGTIMQDMGYQLLRSGSYASPKDFAGLIDAVSVGQVTNVASRILSSKPTVAAFGDCHAVPSYADVQAALRG
jgi:processing peptidase subunit alpha